MRKVASITRVDITRMRVEREGKKEAQRQREEPQQSERVREAIVIDDDEAPVTKNQRENEPGG